MAHTSRRRLSLRLPRVLAEAMEPRLMFDNSVDLATVFAFAEAHFQSAAVTVSFVPSAAPTVAAGQTLTAAVSSPFKMNLFCSHAGRSAVVDGTAQATTPSSNSGIGGEFIADTGTYVSLAPGNHQVMFYILPEAPTEGMVQQVNGDGSLGAYLGNWLIGGAITPNGPGTSPLPFFVTNTNHLAFLNQPTHRGVNVPFSPALQVAVEDANNNILTADNDTSITLLPDTLELNVFTGSNVVTVASGVATFTNLAMNTDGAYRLVASTAGIVFTMQGNPEFGGLIAQANSVTISAGGGGGGGAGLTPVIASSTIPGSVVGGTKLHGALKVKLTNAGSSVEKGFTVDVYASTSSTLDTSVDPLVTSITSRAAVKGGRTIALNVPVTKLPAGLANGNYFLIVAAVDSAGNANSVSTLSTVTVAPPTVALSESLTSTLGASLVRGLATRGTVTLLIENSGNVISRGLTPIDITASTVAGQVGTSIVNLPKNLSIRPGKTARVVVPIRRIPALAEADYFLVVQVTDPFTKGTSIASSIGTIHIAPPLIQLVPAFSAAVVIGARGTATAVMSVTNNGNVPPTGRSTVQLFASTSSSANGATLLISERIVPPIKPGKSRTIRLHLTSAMVQAIQAQGTLVVVVIDPLGGSQSAFTTITV